MPLIQGCEASNYPQSFSPRNRSPESFGLCPSHRLPCSHLAPPRRTSRLDVLTFSQQAGLHVHPPLHCVYPESQFPVAYAIEQRLLSTERSTRSLGQGTCLPRRIEKHRIRRTPALKPNFRAGIKRNRRQRLCYPRSRPPLSQIRHR